MAMDNQIEPQQSFMAMYLTPGLERAKGGIGYSESSSEMVARHFARMTIYPTSRCCSSGF
jgi:hypothetical protein